MAARKDASRTTTGRRRLGRGLTSLISTPVPVETAPVDPTTVDPGAGPTPTDGVDQPDGGLMMVDIDRIHADPRQPRRRFDEAALQA